MSEMQLAVTPMELVAPSALEAITRGEVDTQIATAHKYPRSMQQFKRRGIDMATIDIETAESCIYVRPVGMKNGKQQYAEGLSVRMAEIVGASYGNLRVGSMIVEQTERYVVTRGFAHDLESNFASTSECKEPTVTKDGKPFSEGMRAVIAKAALAKARRDATFQVVPKALCRPIENAARALIAGDTKSLDDRKANAAQYVSRLNIAPDRVWSALGVKGPDDLTSESLMTLSGLRNAIKDGDATVDEAFPATIASGKVGSDPLTDATKTVIKGPEIAPKTPESHVDTPKAPEPAGEPAAKLPDADKLRAELIAKAKGANISKSMVVAFFGGEETWKGFPSHALQDALDNWEETKVAISERE